MRLCSGAEERGYGYRVQDLCPAAAVEHLIFKTSTEEKTAHLT